MTRRVLVVMEYCRRALGDVAACTCGMCGDDRRHYELTCTCGAVYRSTDPEQVNRAVVACAQRHRTIDEMWADIGNGSLHGDELWRYHQRRKGRASR